MSALCFLSVHTYIMIESPSCALLFVDTGKKIEKIKTSKEFMSDFSFIARNVLSEMKRNIETFVMIVIYGLFQ